MSVKAFARFEPRDRADWRRWLRRNHDSVSGVWLVFLKGNRRQISYADSVEEALCFGWIDSTLNPIDAARYMQLFTRRKPKSGWSRINKDRVVRLMRDGLMAAAGLAAIDLAKQHGGWEKLDAIESLTVPPELEAALTRHPKARANFSAFSPFSRKMYLYWINGAKRAETRAARIAGAIAAMEKNLRHPRGAVSKPRPIASVSSTRSRSARGPDSRRR
jgi:uncharacterized protein YdeI (YjbR/CyaY-like superfamily)